MTFSAFIDRIRNRDVVRFADEPGLIYGILDEIESEVTERVKELEAQVPKVVKPEMKRHISGPYYLCLCNAVVDGIRCFNYCPDCGTKLDWKGLAKELAESKIQEEK